MCEKCVEVQPTKFHEGDVVVLVDQFHEFLCDSPPTKPSAWIGNGAALLPNDVSFVIESFRTSEVYVRILTGGGGLGWIRQSMIKAAG